MSKQKHSNVCTGWGREEHVTTKRVKVLQWAGLRIALCPYCLKRLLESHL